MSKWSNNTRYNKVYRMLPIEDKPGFIKLLELSSTVKAYRIRHRGPRLSYQTEPFAHKATHFTAYVEVSREYNA